MTWLERTIQLLQDFLEGFMEEEEKKEVVNEGGSKEECPVCKTKQHLVTMDMGVDLIREMADNEPCKDFCGKELYERRLAVCRKCHNLVAEVTCQQCGCFVHFRAKHKKKHCVLGKW